MVAHSRTLASTWVSIFVALGSICCGYSLAITSTTLTQPSFVEYMGLDKNKHAAALDGTTNGMFIVGCFIGSMLSTFAPELLGRKLVVFLGTLIATVGGALQAGSVNMTMFIIFRLVAGLGVGSLFSTIPLYQSEISPPDSRGMTVGFHGIFVTLGYTLSNWVGVGFFHVNAKGAQWRLPLAIQAIPSLICAMGVLFMPESPRWLVSQDRGDDARKVIQRLHHSRGIENNAFIERELLQIQEQHQLAQSRRVGWKEMFTVPSNRRRLMIGVFIMFCSQFTATMIVAIYNPLLYGFLGHSTNQQLLFTAGYSTVSFAGNFLNGMTLDWVGRVTALRMGWAGCALGLVGICASLGTFTSTHSHASAISTIVFLYLHILMYSMNIDVTTYVYVSEIFPNESRSKGLSISVASYFVILCTQLESGASALDAIGWKLILIYLCFLVVACVPLFLYCPETKNKSLEEIGAIFGDEVTHIPLEITKDTELADVVEIHQVENMAEK
ncbi:uncharacterized protein Z520_01669 [Fonsecaea multimorphosa CBS 102226]|uniref:Major facilitator superfamily (MFS) profile domain-containing protein n=1 Tax=Fonsecaea multimorphosa CBS 102226 TaxID=1442371 RepID=A0A0D2J1D5_9EURO|nr:uncharacterized protein Z520_01669 [Fonsecaea multimorphosa CBS 102226]KIY03202.1 hypothetical protein Z520_01669 [Fonsecaea multimorphosa CBS 102226]